MFNWTKSPLEEVVDSFIDYRGKTPKKTDSGVPLVTAKIVKGGRILEPNEFIAPEDYDSWMTRGLPKVNDVVLTTEAPLGEVGLIKNDKIALAQRIITLRGKPEKLYNPFLKYYLQSKIGQHELKSRASGTTVFGIKASVLKKLPIFLPPLPEQRAIASILSRLDEKIDLLHRQNATLEALAETLFRQWFVEEAGEDWEWIELGELIDVHRGLSYKGAGLAEEGEGVPMHNLNSVHEGGGYKYEGIKYYSGDYKDRYLITPGDVIVTNTEQGHDLLLIGYPAIVPKYYGDPGIFSQHIYKLEIKNTILSEPFLYYLLMTFDVREQITGATNGSTVNMLPKDGIEWAKFKKPSESKIQKFTLVARQLIEKKEANFVQSKQLEKLRDTVLPKLMSGEVSLIT